MISQTAREALLSGGWLSSQDLALQREILRRGRTISREPSEYIFHTGDWPGGIYGIVMGGIGVQIATRSEDFVLATILRQRTWFGVGPLFSEPTRTMSFRATEESTLFHVGLPDLSELQAVGLFSERALAGLAYQSYNVAAGVVRDLLIRDSRRRLAATILRISGVSDDATTAHSSRLRISQSELGEMASVSRHTVNRVLGTFEKAGWISVAYQDIEILDLAAMAAFAAGDVETPS